MNINLNSDGRRYLNSLFKKGDATSELNKNLLGNSGILFNTSNTLKKELIDGFLENHFINYDGPDGIKKFLSSSLATQFKNFSLADVKQFIKILNTDIDKFKTEINKLFHVSSNNNQQEQLAQDQHKLIRFTKDSFATVIKDIALSQEAFINFFRDLTWAPLTFFASDFINSKDNSTLKSQTITQTLISTLAMVIAASVYNLLHGCCSTHKQETTLNKLIKSSFIIGGAGLAIPGWNGMQYMGTQIGANNLGLNPSQSGYFSAIFPGMAEGPTQALAAKSFATYNMGVKKLCDNFLNNPSKFMWQFIKQLVYFASIGAIPGNMWQIAYQALYDIGNDQLPPWAKSLCIGMGVAFIVYSFNILFGVTDTYLNNNNYHIAYHDDDNRDGPISYNVNDDDNLDGVVLERT